MRAGWHMPVTRMVLKSGADLGIELLLHLERERQLGLQALLFLGHDQQLFQILGHAVERFAEIG